MTTQVLATADPAPTRRRASSVRWPKFMLWAAAPVLLFGLGYEPYYLLLGPNLHTVQPGRVYRCAQLDGATLAKVIHEYGVRTVVNLRGTCDPWPWYWEESRTTHALGINQEDVGMSAGRMPSVNEMHRLVEIIDRAEPPLLLHCRRGADRTGLASAIVRLLLSDDSLATARKQLSPRYAHIPLGRPAYLDRFFDSYAEWLNSHGEQHSPALFRHWLERDYRPDECWAHLELLQAPNKVHAGATATLSIRCTNVSMKPWRLRAGTTAGVHARFVVRDPDQVFLTSARAGLFNATVPSGEHIDLTLVVPPLARPGRYSLFVDMVDEQLGWFFQMGSEPLLLDLDVE
ncbi:MAG TPA: tyrosine-protein phosphatase [Gemmataceae bacterium]|nr:tyrosine-protein phosphatase [Gemmataceae bacterium]